MWMAGGGQGPALTSLSEVLHVEDEIGSRLGAAREDLPAGRRLERLGGVTDVAGQQWRCAGVADAGAARPAGGNVAGVGQVQHAAVGPHRPGRLGGTAGGVQPPDLPSGPLGRSRCSMASVLQDEVTAWSRGDHALRYRRWPVPALGHGVPESTTVASIYRASPTASRAGGAGQYLTLRVAHTPQRLVTARGLGILAAQSPPVGPRYTIFPGRRLGARRGEGADEFRTWFVLLWPQAPGSCRLGDVPGP